jgi:ABC-type transporter Mla MlaB component
MSTATTIKLNGPLNIRTIADTKDILMGFMTEKGGPGKTLALDISDSSECDLTLVQLLLSARKTAAEAGMKLKLKGPATGALLEVIERAGLLAGDKTHDSFWLEGKAA